MSLFDFVVGIVSTLTVQHVFSMKTEEKPFEECIISKCLKQFYSEKKEAENTVEDDKEKDEKED